MQFSYHHRMMTSFRLPAKLEFVIMENEFHFQREQEATEKTIFIAYLFQIITIGLSFFLEFARQSSAHHRKII